MAPPNQRLRRAVPAYVTKFLDGRSADFRRSEKVADSIPPGHRFLLYFQALEGVDNDPWQPLKTQKIEALKAVATVGKAAQEVLKALTTRQAEVFCDRGWQRPAELYAPLFTGSGNPHPVENGFAFLSPYGVPYLAGSGIKGVLRRAAEELALLCDDTHGWTLPLVWALFGFDEKSTYFTKNDAGEWSQAYDQVVQTVQHTPDPLLQKLIKIWVDPERRPKNQADFLQKLRESVTVRRAIHFQGLLRFLDAYPQPGCNMAVDILNPHHKDYFQGSGEESPHDAEQPVPVFFLVLAPGTKFVFRVEPSPSIGDLWKDVGNWRKLLNAAFDYAEAWLGFGAKTSVGYGVLGPDRELEKQKEKEEKERAQREAEEQRKREREEEERRCKEAEDAERARRQAQWDALPEDEKIKRKLQEAAERYGKLGDSERKKEREALNRDLNRAIEAAQQIQDSHVRAKLADFIVGVYEQVGWADPGVNKKKREKQEKKRRSAVDALRK
ncbi:type III-B CRISPR module RAMP protein Cmr6 [Desulfosoma caldarium]|uniref:CRISPR type III-B/RAMP module RAMP protein Cmr6 n=1 Tax=Desulfosoma caldarium TaxID=610254 RepID=A0A3N1ULG2_9BACT|nr:type III-B CRISPR module RAMP protein Cmr6 [Desulfosoma caldarium]ROQ92065.1 CRISPR type III-B/RAMP module RAMP protein Cmr6 [Desulfosoma caldarium]